MPHQRFQPFDFSRHASEFIKYLRIDKILRLQSENIFRRNGTPCLYYKICISKGHGEKKKILAPVFTKHAQEHSFSPDFVNLNVTQLLIG